MFSTWRERLSKVFDWNRGSKADQRCSLSRLPRFEALEDRRMLAAEADILFLVDKSNSTGEEFPWIADLVSRVEGLDNYLRDPAQDIDPRYGLVGFGNDGIADLGNSHLLDVNDSNGDSDMLFGDASQLAAVVANLNKFGGDEDAWDGIEHALQEYEFRDGAAVIFVMFRRADGGQNPTELGNDPVNDTLIRDGIFAAMESHIRHA